MQVKDIITQVEDSDVYKKWINDNPDFYLVHLFFDDNPTQVGYYSPKKDSIVTFIVDKKIMVNPESEVFKEKKVIKQLYMRKIKQDIEDINKITRKFIKENYSTELLTKNILVLQVLEDEPIYNITYFTKAFKTLNIKIDAGTGKIISHELSNLIGF